MLGLLVSSGPANAAVSFQVQGPTPAAASFPGSNLLTYTVSATAGGQEERFSIGPVAPPFGQEGLAIDQAGFPTLSGAGTFGPIIMATNGDFGACTSLSGGLHNGGGFGTRHDLSVPPNSTVILTYRFRASVTPWPSVSLAPQFLVSNVMVESAFGPSTLPAPITLTAPEPQRTGQSGVQISFDTKPAGGLLGRLGTPSIHRGKRITIHGSTDPALNRQILRLFVRGAEPLSARSEQTMELLAKVRTNRRGRFSYKEWEPRKLGFWEVAVQYRSQRKFLADDFACSRVFNLVR